MRAAGRAQEPEDLREELGVGLGQDRLEVRDPWWVTEVLPIGITSIAVAAGQGLFAIRDTREAFTDFLDPAVWFIFAALAIGMAFTRTGLTRRIAYRTLLLVGERTERILLGCPLLTMGLTLVMAHTAVAATVYPLFLAVHALYTDDDRPTRFGKALFIGMALSAGAGSVITLLGSARAAVSVGFFRHFTGQTVGFYELSYFLLPLGLPVSGLACRQDAAGGCDADGGVTPNPEP